MISTGLFLYLLNHVLDPRILYPLTVAADINRLESCLLSWALRKRRLFKSYLRHLLAAPVSMGGLGWTRWHTTHRQMHKIPPGFSTILCPFNIPVLASWW